MGSLLAADSFRVRVRGGRPEVRGLGRHLERFTNATVQAAPEHGSLAGAARLAAFIETALNEIAKFGDGFPRLELRNNGELGLRLRALPELRTTIELRSSPLLSSDEQQPLAPRSVIDHPERKGPNIELYAALNREVGAEALLGGPEGQVLEGTTTSILWWQGDALRTVHEQRRVVSVTEALIREIATGLGEAPHSASILVDELGRHEVWAVNAVHGIRVVTNIDGIQLPLPRASRVHHYREALESTWEPIPRG